jgi:putative peptidoglycan lipid II flippase
VPAFVLLRVLQPAFFARQDTKTPMRFSLISVAVNIAGGVGLFFVMGISGIAAATSLAAWISVAQMAVALHRRDTYRVSPAVWFKLARVSAASLALGLLLLAAAIYRHVLEAPLAGWSLAGLGAKEVTVLIVCMAGAGAYVALLLAFGGVTPAEARAALRRRGRAG